MLLGLYIDYWPQKHIEKALSDFGKLIAWEEDPNHLARVLVKARVVSLDEIPWFMVCSDGDGFEGESWSVQCEVIQTRMLGNPRQDEDLPPENPDDFNLGFFDFFGYGQPGQEPLLQMLLKMIMMLLIGAFGLIMFMVVIGQTLMLPKTAHSQLYRYRRLGNTTYPIGG